MKSELDQIDYPQSQEVRFSRRIKTRGTYIQVMVDGKPYPVSKYDLALMQSSEQERFSSDKTLIGIMNYINRFNLTNEQKATLLNFSNGMKYFMHKDVDLSSLVSDEGELQLKLLKDADALIEVALNKDSTQNIARIYKLIDGIYSYQNMGAARMMPLDRLINSFFQPKDKKSGDLDKIETQFDKIKNDKKPSH